MPRIRVSVTCLGERHSLVKFSERIAIITQALKRPGKGGRMGRVKAAYFGFEFYNDAQAFAANIRRRFPHARILVRGSKRLAAAVFEVKVSHDAAEALAWEMAQRQETTSARVERHLQAVASRPSIRPDVPAMPRHTGRTLVTGRSGITVGID